MSYLKHLEQMSTSRTFQNKVEYFQYNIQKYINKSLGKKITILEIGPGVGEFVYFLNRQRISDIDIADNDKEIVEYIPKQYRIKNSILMNQLPALDKKLRQYDLIMLMQVLEHIPVNLHKQLIKTLYAHLKKNGSLIIIVPNANNPLGITERYADIQHTTAFTTQSLNDLLNIAGLKNYEAIIKGFQIPATNGFNIIRKIFQKILHAILVSLMIINGGVFYTTMNPNIMLVIKKK